MSKEKIKNPQIELGLTGLIRQAGWINEEWLPELRGQRGIKKYKEMSDNCPIIGAILFAMEMVLRQTSWRIESGGETDQDTEAKEFLEQCIFEDMDHTWHEFITEVLSMLIFGWSYFEMVFKKRDGKNSIYNDGRIGLKKIAIRSQESFDRWEFADNGDITGMWQMPPPDYRERFIPYWKSLLFRTKSYKNNPEGRSLLRNAYRSYYMKTRMEEIEGIGIERDLAGLPIVTVPAELMSADASPQEKKIVDDWKRVVTSIKRNELEGVVMPTPLDREGKPTGYDFKLLSTGGRRQVDTNTIINRYGQHIAMVVLADFILLGHGKSGSWALSEDKTDIFSLSISAILDSICETFNTKAVPLLFSLNTFSNLTYLPKLAHQGVDKTNIQVVGQYLLNLASAGAYIFPNDELLSYLLKLADLPELPDSQQTIDNHTRPTDNSRQQDLFNKRFKKNKILKRRISPEEERRIRRLKRLLNEEFDYLEESFYKDMGKYSSAAELLSALSAYQFIRPKFAEEISSFWKDEMVKPIYDKTFDKISAKAPKEIEIDFAARKATRWWSETNQKTLNDYMDGRLKQLDETTRTMIAEEITSSLEAGESWLELRDRLMEPQYALSPQRAEVIARTESGIALNMGYIKAGKDSGVVSGVRVHDGMDHDDECRQANGQFWTLEEAEANPLEHPNCQREFEYVFNWEAQEIADKIVAGEE